ncbi:toprim domain-containing protein [Roseococcus pinisoli]|uniref:Toprim domain-containing protein n=1 Tax=Roseococcus pinisoli TaxID=2835040 RepID=A0ABS5QF60_9PROT|nr:toprim domain-containing protein [Roseococcus pinisoli]MBS7812326.1 toprim domain-containing protein [Roseococcus pinisoli]
MDEATARAFLKALGSMPQGSRTAGDGRTHVLARCPLAPWRHEKAIDSKPSFSIAICEGKEAVASCFSCGFRGGLLPLLMSMETLHEHHPAKDWQFAAARQIACNEEEAAPPVLDPDADITPPKVGLAYPEEMRLAMDPAWHEDEVHPYLALRGVSAQTARLWDLRYDAKRMRIVTPIRDFGGTLMGLHGRAVHASNSLRWLAYEHPAQKGATNRHILLGEHKFTPHLPVLVVESVFDLLACFPIWPNVVSPTAATFPTSMMARFDGVQRVVTLFDNDKAGSAARKTFSKHLGNTCQHLMLPEGVKDAGEAKIQELENLLLTAIPAVKSLALLDEYS